MHEYADTCRDNVLTRENKNISIEIDQVESRINLKTTTMFYQSNLIVIEISPVGDANIFYILYCIVYIENGNNLCTPYRHTSCILIEIEQEKNNHQ